MENNSNMKVLFLLGIFVISSLQYRCEARGVTPDQQQELLDIHNGFRRQLAKGSVRGQPGAADMIELVNFIFFIDFR